MSLNKGIEKGKLIKNVARKNCEMICQDDNSIDNAIDYLRDACDVLIAIKQHRGFDSKEEQRYVKELENVLFQFTTKFFIHIVDAFIEEIISSLKAGFRVMISNFMTLEIGERKALSRISFGGTETVTYPAAKNIKCTISSVLKKRINEEE